VRIRGEHGHERPLAVVQQAVGLVGGQLAVVGEDELAATDADQLRDQLGGASLHRPSITDRGGGRDR
jgi:hypothetical protein